MQAVYKITSKYTGEVYIGASVDTHRRFQEHLSKLRAGNHENPRLQSHFTRHGEDDLIFSIFLQCDSVDVMRKLEFEEIKRGKETEPKKLFNIIGVVWTGERKKTAHELELDKTRKEILWTLSSQGFSHQDIAVILRGIDSELIKEITHESVSGS